MSLIHGLHTSSWSSTVLAIRSALDWHDVYTRSIHAPFASVLIHPRQIKSWTCIYVHGQNGVLYCDGFTFWNWGWTVSSCCHCSEFRIYVMKSNERTKDSKESTILLDRLSQVLIDLFTSLCSLVCSLYCEFSTCNSLTKTEHIKFLYAFNMLLACRWKIWRHFSCYNFNRTTKWHQGKHCVAYTLGRNSGTGNNMACVTKPPKGLATNIKKELLVKNDYTEAKLSRRLRC